MTVMDRTDSAERTDLLTVRALLDEALVGLRGIEDPMVPVRDALDAVGGALTEVYGALASTEDYGRFQEHARAAAVRTQDADAEGMEGADRDLACFLARVRLHALAHLVCGAVGEGDHHDPRGVLAPAFHHGSEIEALLRAGLECRFYEVGESLAPDPAELESLVGPRTRALLLIHYLGRPQAAARWREWCDERELL